MNGSLKVTVVREDTLLKVERMGVDIQCLIYSYHLSIFNSNPPDRNLSTNKKLNIRQKIGKRLASIRTLVVMTMFSKLVL